MNFGDDAIGGSTFNKTLDSDDQAYTEISLLSYIDKDHALYKLVPERKLGFFREPEADQLCMR